MCYPVISRSIVAVISHVQRVRSFVWSAMHVTVFPCVGGIASQTVVIWQIIHTRTFSSRGQPGGQLGGKKKANECSLPVETTGYVTTNCDAGKTNKTVAQCDLACASGFNGIAAAAECPTNDGQFSSFGGCQANECSLPVETTRYDTTNCDCEASRKSVAQCNLTCASGFNGIAGAAECPTNDGRFSSFSGCKANECSLATTLQIAIAGLPEKVVPSVT